MPQVADEELRESIASQMMNNVVPHGSNEHHYAQARNTDSALVHTRQQQKGPFLTPVQGCFEKFLFYRGVGSFELPVATVFDGDATAFVNRGEHSISGAILIENRGHQISATEIGEIAPGERVTFNPATRMNMEDLAALVQRTLEAEGLYRKEASSMVNTWRNSWFKEEGRRVLYIVPGQVTDELLPLHIKPAPQESLRVLVGRMEIMSPTDEAELTSLVEQSIQSRARFEADNPRQRNEPQPVYPVPKSIQRWGRMTEPALVRVSKVADDLAIQREAGKLLATLRKN